MSGVRMLYFFKRLMEIHSNPPILHYGFNISLCAQQKNVNMCTEKK